MKLRFLALLLILWSTQIGNCRADCDVITKMFGFLYQTQDSDDIDEKCWRIQVPQYSYLLISVDDFNFRSLPCDEVYLHIYVNTEESHVFCSDNLETVPKVIRVLSDVTIRSVLSAAVTHRRRSQWNYEQIKVLVPTYFNISYVRVENICSRTDHFLCSANACVHKHQVCDGVKDCENGMDEAGCGVGAVSGVKEARDRHVRRLKAMRRLSGWEENIPRVITALYLSGGINFQNHRDNVALYLRGTAEFQKQHLEDELTEKELNLKILQAIIRHSTEPLQVAELSIFLNALMVTCHNLRYFYGVDLLQKLGDRVINSKSPFPGASLALCNANWTLPEFHVLNILELLREESDYPFIQDIQATAVMALTCIRKKTSTLEDIEFAIETYNATIEKFISGQLSDGSFGTVHTTALITQALIASGQETNTNWNVTATVMFLMHQLDSSSDNLATYLILPILNGKSLVDLSDIKCVESRQSINGATRDLTNKLEKRVQIQYSLYIGDLKDVVHTIYLKIAEKSSAYDVMKLAEKNDAKFRFLHRYVASHLYVYSIAGIFNDPESLKFWLLYIADPSMDGKIHHFTKSPDTVILRDEQHLIMWYKTVPMSKGQEDTVPVTLVQEGTVTMSKVEEDTVPTTIGQEDTVTMSEDEEGPTTMLINQEWV